MRQHFLPFLRRNILFFPSVFDKEANFNKPFLESFQDLLLTCQNQAACSSGNKCRPVLPACGSAFFPILLELGRSVFQQLKGKNQAEAGGRIVQIQGSQLENPVNPSDERIPVNEKFSGS